MSKIVISFMHTKGEARDANLLFGILDLETEDFEPIKLNHLPNTQNFVHGMGMTYNGDYFCAGIIPMRERLASNILTINLKTGEKVITYLYFTKAVHGMTSLANNRLLVNSTQTDCLVELCLNKHGHVITEDLYHHFLSPEDWKKLRSDFCDSHEHTDIGYRGPTYVDDNYHTNSVFNHNGQIYGTTFKNVVGQQGLADGFGSFINLTTGEMILDKELHQPHTAFIDSMGNRCCCSSYDFTFIVKTKFSVELDGYTRGIYEDKKRKGYWVGISAFRKYSQRLSKWVEYYRGDQPLEGARIQFVSYEGEVGGTIELKDYGKEIFDLLPIKQGKWN